MSRRLERRKKHHSYYKSSKRVVGASTVAGINKPIEPLMGWAARLAREGKDWKKERDATADSGDIAHFLVDCYIGGDEPDLSEFSAEEISIGQVSFNKFREWWDANQIEPVAKEEKLVSHTLDYGGMIDLIGRQNGELILFDWKGLALDTEIPIPSGWTTMGELKIGDYVFDEAGDRCHVIAISPVMNKRCFEIEFNDKSKIICDEDHLWKTYSGISTKPKERILSTLEIKNSIKNYGQNHHRIPVTCPLMISKHNLPIDPYLFGLWLGDGTIGAGAITEPNEKVWDILKSRGHKVAPRVEDTSRSRTIYGLRTLLRTNELLTSKKIPTEYLRASLDDRIDLFQGLMDSDGSWNKTRKQASFDNTNKNLVESVMELGISLGMKANFYTGISNGFGKKTTYYRASFSANNIPQFKAKLTPGKKITTASQYRIISSIAEVQSVPTKCIQVDSPSSLYLCGRAMIPTHNTSKAIYPSHLIQVAGGYKQLWDEQREPLKKVCICRIGREPGDELDQYWVSEELIPIYWNCFRKRLDLYYADRELPKTW